MLQQQQRPTTNSTSTKKNNGSIKVSFSKSYPYKIFAAVAVFLFFRAKFVKYHTISSASKDYRDLNMQMSVPSNQDFFTIGESAMHRVLRVPLEITQRSLQSFTSAAFDTGPSTAWLACFPQSGALFITRAIHTLTETSTAINYGNVLMEDDLSVYINKYPSANVYQDHDEGPYFFSNYLPLPTSGSILTITYCNGFCYRRKDFCAPPDFTMSRLKEFFNGCVVGSYYPTAGGTTTQTEIDFSKVSKAIHLVRNPFSNIIARFEHQAESAKQLGQTGWLRLYPPQTGEGFQKFCRTENTWGKDFRFRLNKREWLKDPRMQEIALEIPCYEDFYRYAMWHNHMFQLKFSELSQIDIKVIFYEDFETDPVAKMNELILYLGLEKVSTNIPPVENVAVSWADFYTEPQKVAIKEWLQFYSTPISWSQIGKYFL